MTGKTNRPRAPTWKTEQEIIAARAPLAKAMTPSGPTSQCGISRSAAASVLSLARVVVTLAILAGGLE